MIPNHYLNTLVNLKGSSQDVYLMFDRPGVKPRNILRGKMFPFLLNFFKNFTMLLMLTTLIPTKTNPITLKSQNLVQLFSSCKWYN